MRNILTVILKCAPIAGAACVHLAAMARLEGCGPNAEAVALRGSLRSHLRVTEKQKETS